MSSSSKSNNSYRLLASSSLSSITNVSSQLNDETSELTSVSDNEQWPAPPIEVISPKHTVQQEHWHYEKYISLKNQQSKNNSCIMKATMVNKQIFLSDPSSNTTRLLPAGKHVTMKVVFRS